MPHVVLLGDSIFDNAAYVPGDPDVIEQLRSQLAPEWRATLRAVDGSITRDVASQLGRLPSDATHLVVSTGGNDALLNIGILEAPARSAADTLSQLAGIAENFDAEYAEMLARVRARALPFAVCTIYNGNLPEQELQRLASTTLTVFNDVILRQAIQSGIPVIDLRAICCAPEDYANPIEPSAVGGEKIAGTIAHVLQEHDFSVERTVVYRLPGAPA